jgi:predicted RND superfamily exporter protein
VLLTVLLLFLLLPGAMETRRDWPSWWPRVRPRSGAQSAPAGWEVGQIAARIIWRFAGAISLASFVLLAACGVGLTWLQSSIDVVSLLDPQNRAVRDFHWFEQHIGPLVSVEVVIHFERPSRLDWLQQLELVRSAQQALREVEILDGAMSAATFFPRIPAPGGFRATARRVAMRRELEAAEQDLVEAQFLHVSDQEQAWRISARVRGLRDFDYSRFLDRLREKVSPVIAQHQQAGDQGIDATYTGITSVVYEAEEALLSDLFNSFLTALACVSLIMVLALRSIRAGLIAMVPNVFPTFILFGGTGWLGWTVGIGTVMTASVALGIAVDGTFHFLKWFRYELQLGKPRREAVAYAYRHCGRALVQTTLICACGMLVFALSDFLPARYFSMNLFLLLIAALIGDLIVLPALLVGPTGSFFVQANHPDRSPPKVNVG